MIRLFRNKVSLRFAIILHRLFPKAKLFFELLYWKFIKLKEIRLSNNHYCYFFTEYFGFNESDYHGKSILDIGCGPRGSLEWASTAKRRIGLDPLADKYRKLGINNHQMEYVNAASEQIPFADHDFDFISSFNSLDHVDDVHKTVREISRCLKKDGYFLLICDIHTHPTICEPTIVNWGISIELRKNGFVIEQEKHFEGKELYKSIRKGITYDHENQIDRYAVLTVLAKKIEY